MNICLAPDVYNGGETCLKLQEAILRHSTISVMQQYCDNLAQIKVPQSTLKTLTASLFAFFRHVPTGLMTLAIRISDWFDMQNEPVRGTRLAAEVVAICLDEYGLNGGPGQSHQELFLRFAKSIGVNFCDLFDANYILPAANDLGCATRRHYRELPLGSAIGFHVASELISLPEFHALHRAFSSRSLAPLSVDLDFIEAHCAAEPGHATNAIRLLEGVLMKNDQGEWQNVLSGASTFLELFGQVFRDLGYCLGQQLNQTAQQADLPQTEAYALSY